VVKVRIPPLRERKEDLPELVQAILDGMGERGQPVELSADLWGALREHDWPGNVRELRNTIERAMLRTPLGPVAPEHIGLQQATPQADTLDYRAARQQALDSFERSFVLHLLKAREGNVSRAARDAGIDRGYLYRLIRRHQIPVREEPE
jgi:DNA-binding NtrC family response regulator